MANPDHELKPPNQAKRLMMDLYNDLLACLCKYLYCYSIKSKIIHAYRHPSCPSHKPHVLPIRKYFSIFEVFSKNIQKICPICPILKGVCLSSPFRMSHLLWMSDPLWTSNMTTLIKSLSIKFQFLMSWIWILYHIVKFGCSSIVISNFYIKQLWAFLLATSKATCGTSFKLGDSSRLFPFGKILHSMAIRKQIGQTSHILFTIEKCKERVQRLVVKYNTPWFNLHLTSFNNTPTTHFNLLLWNSYLGCKKVIQPKGLSFTSFIFPYLSQCLQNIVKPAKRWTYELTQGLPKLLSAIVGAFFFQTKNAIYYWKTLTNSFQQYIIHFL